MAMANMIHWIPQLTPVVVAFFHHKHHTVIQKIGNLVFDVFRFRIFRCNYNFRTLFPKFLQNLIGSFPKQIIGIGTILRMCFTFLDNIIHALKYLQRIFLNILFLYDAIEKTGTVSGVTGSPPGRLLPESYQSRSQPSGISHTDACYSYGFLYLTTDFFSYNSYP